jgi:hypothetical protein
MLNRCRALTAASPEYDPPNSPSTLRNSRYNRRLPCFVDVAQPYMLTIAARIRSIGNADVKREARNPTQPPSRIQRSGVNVPPQRR